MENLKDTAVKAIFALYDPQNVQKRQEANQWLMKFVATPEAWDISKELLSSTYQEVQFVAAQSLWQKTRNDWNPLPEEVKKQLPSQLLGFTLQNASLAHIVRVRLCLTVAAAGIRAIPNYWPTMFTDLLNLVVNPPSIPNVKPLDIRIAVMVILSLLPEELEAAILSHSKQDEVSKYLMNNAPQLLELIRSVLQQQVNNEEMTHIKLTALQCVKNWVKFGVSLRMMMNGVPSLLNLCFDAMADTTLYGDASDVLLETLSRRSSGDATPNFKSALDLAKNTFYESDENARREIYSRLISLRSLYEKTLKGGVYQFNENYGRAIVQVVAAFCESNTSLLGCGLAGQELTIQLLNFMLECTNDPFKQTSELTLPFWNVLEKDLANPKEYAPLFEHAFGILLRQCSYNFDFDFNVGWNDPMSKEDFDAYRKEAENTFRAVYNILEQQFVHILWTSLQQHGDKWQTAESIYFALLTAAERISPTEPAIAQFCNWALQNNSRDNIFLSTTIVRFLGNFAEWFEKNASTSNFLEATIKYIMHFLTSNNADTSFVAAQALRKFCFKCESGLLPVLKTVFEQYTAIFTKIKVEDRSLIVEGFVHLIYNLPVDQVTGALQMIVSPILANIQQINAQASSSEKQRLLLLELNCLTTAMWDHQIDGPSNRVIKRLAKKASTSVPKVSATGAPHPLVLLFTNSTLGTILTQLHDEFINNGSERYLVQSLYNIYIAALRTSERSFAPVLPALIPKVMSYYFKQPNNSSLDLLREVIEYFGADEDKSQAFSDLLLNVSQKTFELLQKSVTAHLELVQGYLELLYQAMKTNANLLTTQATSAIPSTALQLSVQALTSKDVETVGAALLYLNVLLLGPHRTIPAWTQYVQTALQHQANALVKALLGAIVQHAGHFKLLPKQAELLFRLIQDYRPVIEPTLIAIFAEEGFLHEEFSPEDKQTVLSIFLKLKPFGRFKSFITDFTDICNKKMAFDALLSYLM
jgi:hypothetical protein